MICCLKDRKKNIKKVAIIGTCTLVSMISSWYVRHVTSFSSPRSSQLELKMEKRYLASTTAVFICFGVLRCSATHCGKYNNNLGYIISNSDWK